MADRFAKAIAVTDPNGEIVVRGSGEYGTLSIGAGPRRRVGRRWLPSGAGPGKGRRVESFHGALTRTRAPLKEQRKSG